MPFLQSSGAISIDNIKTQFGGPTSPALSNYYRGGSYIPSTKSVSTTTREPASGESYAFNSTAWMKVDTYNRSEIYWGGTFVGSTGVFATSFTTGNTTYFRGSSRGGFGSYGGPSGTAYGIYRQVTTTSTVNINAGIPTSGTISLNQFYNAEKP